MSRKNNCEEINGLKVEFKKAQFFFFISDPPVGAADIAK